MRLRKVKLPSNLEASLLSPSIDGWLGDIRQHVEQFWDSAAHQKTQWVSCDTRLVTQVVQWMIDQGTLEAGQRFLEWGCGFGAVCGAASLLGMEAYGIESEPFLVGAAGRYHARHGSTARIRRGNFLPAGAAELSTPEDPRVALQCTLPAAYQAMGLTLRDFNCIFAYPWPGEGHFLKLVFQQMASHQAYLILYSGPYEIELFQKLHVEAC